MKKILKSSIIFLASAALFASCQPEELKPQAPETFTLTINATAEDAANAADTKTYIDGTQVYWHDTEAMAAIIFKADGSSYNGETYNNENKFQSTTFTPSDENKKVNLHSR